MPSRVCRSVRVAKLPTVTTTFGRDELELALQPRVAGVDLLGLGSRLSGGRHFTTFAM